jgi:hypothetical protein
LAIGWQGYSDYATDQPGRHRRHMLYALLLIFAPMSCAHFNSAITLSHAASDIFTGIRRMDAQACT